MKRILIFLGSWLMMAAAIAQTKQQLAQAWADSVLKTLSKDQRIAQLMIVRAHSNLGAAHVQQVTNLIRQYNVGGLCFFQGGPVRQAQLTNYYQSIAQTPLLITIDGEWGLGMRLDSVISLPRQLMLGATPDAGLAYAYGALLAAQCKRMGIQVNFAPVVDVNNNPRNPVINDRSFGEDKQKVALWGLQVMKGMQDHGVMACAKHFPGHGDTDTDSHYDLPVIKKATTQLDSLELYPFRELISNGVGSIMVAHLYIPSIDSTPNLATSLSAPNVTGLLRNRLGYTGLTFTDALEMQGVKKFFPDGEASAQSLVAGNDLLCLPGDVAAGIVSVKNAIRKKKLSWAEIDARVLRVLVAKYMYGLHQLTPVDTTNLVQDLNAQTDSLASAIATHAITLVRNTDGVFPIHPATLAFVQQASKEPTRIAYLAVGTSSDNYITSKCREQLNADVFFFNYKQDAGNVASMVAMLQKNYQQVVVGVHQYSRRPANSFGISKPAMQLINEVLQLPKTSLVLFGNPYAAANFGNARNLFICYEDNERVQQAAFNIITGKAAPLGRLPVTVSSGMELGAGLAYPAGPAVFLEKKTIPGTDFSAVDSIITDAINRKAFPGCVVLAAKDGAVVFEKAYGSHTYEADEPIDTASVFDMASVTKICATTLAVMKLYEEGRISLDAPLEQYLPWVAGTNKARLLVRDVLLHQAGLKAWIPFFKEIIDSQTGVPEDAYYENFPAGDYTVRVAENFYLRRDWVDTMFYRILQSELGPQGKYVYSDNDFIFLGKIVEAVSGTTLDNYVRQTFYEPLNLHHTGFLPRNHLPAARIVPTEREVIFRRQLLRGDVHDPGAAMFGGVAGHAGLFSNAYDMAVLMQLLLNGGSIGNRQFFQPQTVALFTSYGAANSRRGLGFDKPEKDNATRRDPYPATLVSPSTFGHTGFTGTCVWADPEHKIVFVFLSNRVYPDGGANARLLTLQVRRKVHDALYKTLLLPEYYITQQ